MRALGLILLCLFSGVIICAREESPLPENLIHHFSAGVGADYVPSSIIDPVFSQEEKDPTVFVNSSLAFYFKYSFSFCDPGIRNYYPGGYQGIGANIMALGLPNGNKLDRAQRNIGLPVSLYVFQGAPFLKMPHGFSLGYEWQFGASGGWMPYSYHNQGFNLKVGSAVNAYLNLGLTVRKRFNKRFSLEAGLSLSHFSNGNTSWPNPGVNALGLRIGMVLDPAGSPGKYPDVKSDTVSRKRLDFDLSVWGAPRRRVYKGGEEPVLLSGYYGVAGLSFSPLYRFGRWIKAGGSADFQWDGSSGLVANYISGSVAEEIKYEVPSVGRQLSFGLAAHAELCMPIFSLNIGVGYNFLAPRENRKTYQSITLKTYLSKVLYLNVGYQLRDFSQQSNLMLGMGVTL